MLTSATGFFCASSASWYMKHSLPSGAQRTCQSPKVSLTISITSGCAGRRRRGAAAVRRPRRSAPGGRRAGGGRLGAGAAGAPGLCRGRPPALPGRRRRCGRRSAAGAALLGGERRRQRQSAGRPESGGIGSVASAARIPLIASSRDCHSPPRLSTAPGLSGCTRSRPSEKGTAKVPFSPLARLPCRTGRTYVSGRYDG